MPRRIQVTHFETHIPEPQNTKNRYSALEDDLTTMGNKRNYSLEQMLSSKVNHFRLIHHTFIEYLLCAHRCSENGEEEGCCKLNKYSEQREFTVAAVSGNSMCCAFVWPYFN